MKIKIGDVDFEFDTKDVQEFLEFDWKIKDTELSESIPPAYTHYISQDFFNIRINN